MKFYICLLFFLLSAHLPGIEYKVRFLGLQDKETLNALQSVSDLVSLQNKSPASSAALKYRAENDLEKFETVMKAFGYYDAKIDVELEEEKNYINVYLLISPGPRYVFKQITVTACPEDKEIKNCPAVEEKLKILINKPAVSLEIPRAEKSIIYNIANCGYPFAKIDKKEYVVDYAQKGLFLDYCVDEGDMASFGYTSILGLKNIDPRYVEKKIVWEEGQPYNIEKIDETQKRLLNSNLFSSVVILQGDKVNEKHELPITIRFEEAAHKTFSIGASYATVDGFGGDVSWINRNFRKIGQILSLDATVSQKMYMGAITYKIPDFIKLDQNYVLRFEAFREKIFPYLAFSYAATSRLDRQFTPNSFFSWGLQAEFVDVTQSGNNGKYMLWGLPMFLKSGTAKDLLNPTKGYFITYVLAPYYNSRKESSFFVRQILILNYYLPLDKRRIVVFASRLQLGSVAGATVRHIPMTKLMLGGTDDDLRGYRYKTVSPRNSKNQPVGGRSAIYFTFEPRFRVSNNIGLVPFIDVGTVSLKIYPNPAHKWYKSAGFGIRYFTLFGPLRLDVGFPLDRRRGIDPKFRIYANIGQTF